MRSQFTPRHLLWVLFTVAVAVAVACGGSVVKSPTAATTAVDNSTPSGAGTNAGTGTLSLTIKDSPFSEALALLVTFSEVSVHASGDTWVKLPFAGGATERTCDLKKLQTAFDVLGVGDLAAGHYTQLRLTVASAKLYFTGPSVESVACAPVMTGPAGEIGTPIDIPSGVLKLNREFDLPAAATTQILLDFNGDQSVHKTGNGKYMMTPVIGIVSVQ
jgi:hypothetical protein